MSKRFAGSQMTREGLENGHSNNVSDDETPFDKPAIASESVMSTRKIAMPKRKMGGFTTGDKPNMFKAIKDDKKPQGANLNEKLTALNVQFKNKINSTLESDPVADISFLFDKYKTYSQQLRSEAKTNGAANAPSTSSFTFGTTSANMEKPKNPFALPAEVSKPTITVTEERLQDKKEQIEINSDSDSEEEKLAVNVEGPKFVLTKKPTTSDPPFSFGGNKRKEPDSDSDSEIEIKGPQFTFSGTVSSGAFTLPKNDASRTEESEPAEKPTDNKPASIFGNSSQSKPIFPPFESAPSIEKNEGSKPAVPAFGSNKTNNDNSSSPFSFSFSNNKDSAKESENKKDEAKPASSFGTFSAPAPSADSKPSFSFSAPVQSTTSANKDLSKPSFTFGAMGKENSNDEAKKPSFTFGTSTTSEKPSESSKPSFTFGKASAGSTPFTFGKQETDKKDEKKPTFTFGATAASTVPAFSFGANKSEEAPPQGDSTGFKFSLPFASSATTSDKDTTKEASEKNSEDASAEAQEEPSKALNLSNGEENEILLFSQRAKLMIFNTETKAYDSRGVGELKVLQNKEDNTKARILCRSDGMGHILLNTSIIKSFSYEALDPNNENLVKCPAVKAEGGLDTFVVKVKQKADGRKLVQAIKDAQSPM
ncbi:Nup2 [Kluyveromyces lactis]|nr:Nup2 [Kluyveromyces lactis]